MQSLIVLVWQSLCLWSVNCAMQLFLNFDKVSLPPLSYQIDDTTIVWDLETFVAEESPLTKDNFDLRFEGILLESMEDKMVDVINSFGDGNTFNAEVWVVPNDVYMLHSHYHLPMNITADAYTDVLVEAIATDGSEICEPSRRGTGFKLGFINSLITAGIPSINADNILHHVFEVDLDVDLAVRTSLFGVALLSLMSTYCAHSEHADVLKYFLSYPKLDVAVEDDIFYSEMPNDLWPTTSLIFYFLWSQEIELSTVQLFFERGAGHNVNAFDADLEMTVLDLLQANQRPENIWQWRPRTLISSEKDRLEIIDFLRSKNAYTFEEFSEMAKIVADDCEDDMDIDGCVLEYDGDLEADEILRLDDLVEHMGVFVSADATDNEGDNDSDDESVSGSESVSESESESESESSEDFAGDEIVRDTNTETKARRMPLRRKF